MTEKLPSSFTYTEKIVEECSITFRIKEVSDESAANVSNPKYYKIST